MRSSYAARCGGVAAWPEFVEIRAMSEEQQQYASEDAEPARSGATAQQQQQPQPSSDAAHAGQGSDSIMKELREWEKRRSHDSIAKRRHGPNN
jgi:hypothetical protein